MSRSAPKSRLRYATAGCIVIVALAVHSGCDDHDGYCRSGYPCECAGTDDCYLECRGADCELVVHDVVRGEGACGDYCDSDCFAVSECSLWCGANCSSSVHDAVGADTVCGDDCQHECFDVESCQVRAGANSHIRCHNLSTCEIDSVGPGSIVECHSVGRCEVTCAGDCALEYTAISGENPELVCPTDAPLTRCSPTELACGDCGR